MQLIYLTPNDNNDYNYFNFDYYLILCHFIHLNLNNFNY